MAIADVIEPITQKLVIEPLTQAAFAEFGDVIETENRDYFMINNGSTRRYHKLAKATIDNGSDVIMSIFEAEPLSYPLTITMLERHPKGSQAFIPLFKHQYLVVVAPKDNEPNPAKIRAFIASGDQGVNYHQGVWHHPVLVLKSKDKFLVVDRSGESSNCDEHFFEKVVLALDLTTFV